MSNETMTDAKDWLLSIMGEHDFTVPSKAFNKIVARLRGEAAQGAQQAVAWRYKFGTNGQWHYTETPQRAVEAAHGFKPAEALYTRPQPAAPAPVAGDAVAALRDAESGIAAIFESGDWGMADDTIVQGLNVLEDIRTALAQDRASQGEVIETNCTDCGTKVFAWPQHRDSSRCLGCFADGASQGAAAGVPEDRGHEK